MDAEFKPAWYLRGEMDEEDFIRYRLPELGLSGMRNPEKEFSPYPPDLIVEGLLSDLKAQSTPFFTADRYGIDPQCAVTFNVKDERHYRERYPEVVVFFDVRWTTTRATPRTAGCSTSASCCSWDDRDEPIVVVW